MATSASDQGATPTKATRNFFTFNPSLLLADLSNAALDIHADGMDALDRRIVEDLAFCGLDMPSIAAIQQGLEHLFDSVTGNIDQAMLSFERLAAVTSLSVPAELFIEQPAAPASAPVCPEEEAALDAELEALRAQAMQGRAECLALRQQLRGLDADLAAAGDSDRYRPLVDAVATHKEGVLDDMAAISAATAKLQPLLGRAAALQQQRRHQKQQEAAPLDGEEDDVAAAAGSRSRQQMSASGATLAQLKALNRGLAP